MAEDVPRRMRRFYRQGAEQKGGFGTDGEAADVADYLMQQMPEQKGKGGNDKEVTMHLTLQEVKKFREQHKRYPEKAEYDQIAENIFQQLKDTQVREQASRQIAERRGREAGKRGEGRHSAAGKTGDEKEWEQFGSGEKQAAGQQPNLRDKELASLSVEDLFAEEKKGAQSGAQKPAGEEFNLGELGEAEEQCPKCGKQGSKVVFCPECGAAFCYACAKRIEKIGSIETVVCPECGKKFSQ